MKEYTLECCVDSVESAINAALGGADRLELCANLVIGGTTPGVALFEAVRKNVDLRVHVLLRPRCGDFFYSESEFKLLLREVGLFRELGAQGVVFGCLDENGRLDVERMHHLIAAAGNMSVTLHRAIDVCVDPMEALEQAKALGVQTILTSGGKGSALEGKALLQALAEHAGKVEIMAGAGINAGVICEFFKDTMLTSFHMSGKKVMQSGMKYRSKEVSMGLPGLSEYEVLCTDADLVRHARTVIDERKNNEL